MSKAKHFIAIRHHLDAIMGHSEEIEPGDIVQLIATDWRTQIAIATDLREDVLRVAILEPRRNGQWAAHIKCQLTDAIKLGTMRSTITVPGEYAMWPFQATKEHTYERPETRGEGVGRKVTPDRERERRRRAS